MALIYNATFDKNTRKLSFEDRAGNEIYSFTVPERGPAVDGITKPLTFKATQDGSTVKLTKSGTPDGEFQTSRDGGNTWTDYTIDTAIALNTGDKVSFRAKADRTTEQSSGDYFHFEMTGKIEAWHNVMSLYRTNDFSTFKNVVGYAFSGLFSGCTSLTKAPVLPATTLSRGCYSSMFSGCTSLTKAPELPATTLDNICYQYMFKGCTSLSEAPALPATTLYIACYSDMFDGCTSLTKAPALPVTTLNPTCYNGMFRGCTSLTKAPALPATTLANNCYYDMFGGCTSLTEAPELPATTLANFCYYSMFNGCTSLTKAPKLPVTTLAEGCYGEMFSGCTSLSEAPKLPATTLITDCYTEMFYGCTSLTKAPELPSTKLASRCYQRMFKGCTSLTKAPDLPSTTLASRCYFDMFSGCSNLNEVRCQISSSYSASDMSSYTSSWLSNVSQTGTFYTNADANWPSGTNGIPTGWNRVNEGAPTVDDIAKPLTFRATQNGSTVKLSSDGSPSGTFQTSRDGGNTWTNYTTGTAITLNTGDEVSFRAKYDRTTGQNGQNYFRFQMKGKIEAWNNVMSMYRTNDFATYNTAIKSAFYRLFYGCTSLTKAPVLPATTLTERCYAYMFQNCTSLVNAPALPATALANYCYNGMFMGCTSLVNAPELPVTTLALSCYAGMFNGCTSLTKAPALPATTLTDRCYSSMFNGCTSLTKAPALPATTLANYCYNGMFNGCTSLTKAPELPATTLTNYCYDSMFNGCSRLNEVRCNVPSSYSSDTISSTYTSNWLSNVSPTGTFYTNADANWSTGASGIPEGWNRVPGAAPATSDITKPLTFRATQNGSTVSLKKNGLPEGSTFQTSRDGGNTWEDYTIDTAIALNTGDEVSFRAKSDRIFEQSDSKYFQFNMTGKIEAWHNVMSMYRTNDFATYESVMKFAFYYLFKDCTSLIKAPRLPATTLAVNCYRRMFDGCTSLAEVPYLPATSLAETCYWGMFNGCTSLTETPILSATRLGIRCYNQMFSGCSSLNKVHCHIPSSYNTEYMSTCADGWLYAVSPTGTFYTNADANWSTGKSSGIPEGWTRVND